MKKIEFFKVEGDKINRVRKHCPKCGPAVFLGDHKNRLSCGKCGYTEFKSGGKKEPVPQKTEEKPEGPIAEEKSEKPTEPVAPETTNELPIEEKPVEEHPKEESQTSNDKKSSEEATKKEE